MKRARLLIAACLLTLAPVAKGGVSLQITSDGMDYPFLVGRQYCLEAFATFSGDYQYQIGAYLDLYKNGSWLSSSSASYCNDQEVGIWIFPTETSPGTVTYTAEAYDDDGAYAWCIHYVSVGTGSPPSCWVDMEGGSLSSGSTISSSTVNVSFYATDADDDYVGIRPNILSPSGTLFNNGGAFITCYCVGDPAEHAMPVPLTQSGTWLFWTEARDGVQAFTGTFSTSSTVSLVVTQPPPPPDPPSSLAAAAIDHATIVLSWSASPSAGAYYELERKLSASGTYAKVAEPSAGATTYNNTGLTASTGYTYRLRAARNGLYSSYTTEVSATTLFNFINDAAFVSQSAPATMWAGASATVSVTMQNTGNTTWNDNSPQPYNLGSQNPADNQTWGLNRVSVGATPVAPGQNKTFTFSITAPTTSGTYNFQWKMVRDGGGGWFGTTSSNTTIQVLADNEPPTAPEGLAVTSLSSNAATITWTASADNAGVTNYQIFRNGVGGNWKNATSFTFSSLAPLTTYTITVRAVDGAGNTSDHSAPLVFTTLPASNSSPPTLPSDWATQYGINTNETLGSADDDGLTNIAKYNLGKTPGVPDQGSSALGNTMPAGWPTPGLAPSGSTNPVGATAGEFTVDKNGAATYTIPIAVTPGTAGVEPKITLNYSSQAGPGIAGFGWSLGGLSAITRGPQTMHVDNQIRAMDFTSDDRFYLDGQRLVVTGSGVYGADGAEYRTEIESFTRVVSYDSTGGSPGWFRAWTKSGLIIEFGHTADSRFRPQNQTAPLSWAVSKISDTSGNYMTFHYTVDAASGEQVLDSIKYTGHDGAPSLQPYASLEFEYEQRCDPSFGFIRGAKLSSTKRLAAIKSYYGDGTTIARSLVRAYALSYEETPTPDHRRTKRSMLASVVESGTGGVTRLPITFTYSNPPDAWSAGPAISHNYDYEPLITFAAVYTGTRMPDRGVTFIDITGNGRPDMLQKLGYSGTAANSAWLNISNRFDLVASNHNGVVWGQPEYMLPDPLTISTNDIKKTDSGVRFADFNNDGLIDAMDEFNGAVYLSTGTGFAYSVRYSLPALSAPDGHTIEYFSYTPLEVLDLDGDGRVDVSAKMCQMRYRTPYPQNILVTTYPSYTWINNGGGNDNELGSAWTYVEDLTHSIPCDRRDGGVRFLDLNGDGMTDIIQSTGTGTTPSGNAWIRTSTGWHIDPAYKLPNALNATYNDATYLGGEFVDLNGDGLPDFISRNTSLNNALRQNVVLFNTGSGWISAWPSGMGAFLAPSAMQHDFEPQGVAFVDINGDGIPDSVRNYDGSATTCFGTGTGWTPFTTDTGYAVPYMLATGSFGNPGTQFIDLNGDGALDFVWSWSKETLFSKGAYINQRVNPDRLVSITNGHSVTVSVAYAPLTELGYAPVYEKGTGAVTPVQDVIGPLYVVKTVTLDDGAGGTYTVDYRYGGLRYHLEHGDLGFEWMQATDSRTKIRTKTTFRQDYPFIGLPDESTTSYHEYVSSHLTLSETTYDYDFLTTENAKIIFPYAAVTTQKTWELNAALTSHIITTSTYDSYGNATVVKVDTSGGANTHTRTITNNYNDANWVSAPSQTSLDCWLPGRPTSTTVVTVAPDPSGVSSLVQERITNYVYYPRNGPNAGLLHMEIIEPGNASDPNNLTLELKNTYEYNEFGCRTQTTTTGEGLDPAGRITTTTYDSTYGRFPESTTNAAGHIETHTYCPVLGVLLETTGPNNLTTSWEYDAFARVVKETRADGTQTTTNRHWTSPGTMDGALYYVETKSFKELSGTRVYQAPPSAVFYDKFSRPIATWNVHPGGSDGAACIVVAETYYDEKGRASITSLPHFKGTPAPGHTEVIDYDALNRPVQISTPDDEVQGGEVFSFIEYNGLTTRTKNSLNQVEEVTKNMQGQVMHRINNSTGFGSAKGRIDYAYDAGNNLVKTTVLRENGAAVETHFHYDNRGRKTSMTSPDMGTWTYEYNALGELTKQTDAKGQVTEMTYDNLGRPLTRTDYDSLNTLAGTTTWTYDNTPKGVGKLSEALVEIPNKPARDYKETYLYDSLGRLKTLTRRIDSIDYPVTQHYDPATGLPTITEYSGNSGNFRVRNVYNALGFLKEVRAANDPLAPPIPGDVLPNHLFWQADSYSVTGAIESSTLGNGFTTDRVISPVTGRLRAIASGIRPGTHAQDIAYTHNQLGHVTKRQDYILGREETFTYDGLNRLTNWTMGATEAMPGWGTVVPPATPGTVTTAYDALGNITSKTGCGTYNYSGLNNAGPHAVTSVLDAATTRTYTYDANGNMTARTDINRTQDWTTFNQVEKITQGITWAQFRFGANRERIVQERNDGTATTKTTYIGSLLEIVTGPNNFTEKKYHIYTPEGKIATRTLRSDTQNETVETRYYHSDGLGSITALSDEYGRIDKRFAYDPWGVRTLLLDYHPGPGGALTRGFTGHEHLDDFGLIHMNGRIFDPALARFLSADSIVQSAGNSQSYNRYSYCANNPVNYTDPTGEIFTWSVGSGGFSFGVNFVKIPVGFGINVGWSNGGSIGFYGEVGPRSGPWGVTARISFDYGFRSKKWTTTVGVSASYCGAGINASYNRQGGWNMGISFGEGASTGSNSSISLSIGLSTSGVTWGASGTWDENIRGRRATVTTGEATTADYLSPLCDLVNVVNGATTESGTASTTGTASVPKATLSIIEERWDGSTKYIKFQVTVPSDDNPKNYVLVNFVKGSVVITATGEYALVRNGGVLMKSNFPNWTVDTNANSLSVIYGGGGGTILWPYTINADGKSFNAIDTPTTRPGMNRDTEFRMALFSINDVHWATPSRDVDISKAIQVIDWNARVTVAPDGTPTYR